jgi:hypothetical protein
MKESKSGVAKLVASKIVIRNLTENPKNHE